MFEAVPPPVISSSKLYIQHRVVVKPLLLPAIIVAGTLLVIPGNILVVCMHARVTINGIIKKKNFKERLVCN
jgi:hypothetical protein